MSNHDKGLKWRRNDGVIFSLLSTAIISWSPVINKFALVNLSVELASFLNTLFVVVFALIYMRLRDIRITFVNNIFLWSTGIFEALGTLFLYLSLGLLNPFVFGFINRFAVVFAVLLSVIFLKETITRKELYLIATAILGTFLFVSRGGDISGLVGILLALAYNFFFAVSNLFAKISMRYTNSTNIVFYSKSISLLLIAIYILTTAHQSSRGPYFAETGLLALSALANYLGLLLAYEGFARLGYAKSSIIRSISPLLVMAYSWPFFPIELNIVNILGAAILLISVGLLTLIESKKAAAA